MVHSSLRSLGPLPGGAESVVQSLLEAIGPQGTLLMPALSYESVGRRSPYFDVLKTPSCVGALPEYFRTRPGTLRSVHPTHSVAAVGRLAHDLLVDHVLDTTPCGPHSPFSKLPQVNGQILFIGCGLRPNTSMHAIEEHVVPLYLFGDVIEYQVHLPADSSTGPEHDQIMRVRSHYFRGWVQRYDRLEGLLTPPGLRQGQVLQASCCLIEAATMWPAALAALRGNPLFFIDQVREDQQT